MEWKWFERRQNAATREGKSNITRKGSILVWKKDCSCNNTRQAKGHHSDTSRHKVKAVRKAPNIPLSTYPSQNRYRIAAVIEMKMKTRKMPRRAESGDPRNGERTRQ
jgi:hypothetical protein